MVNEDGAGVADRIEGARVVRAAGEVAQFGVLVARVDVRGGVECSLEVAGAEEDERESACERVESARDAPGHRPVVAHHGDVRGEQLEGETNEARGGASRSQGTESTHLERVEEDVPDGAPARVEEEQPRFTARRKAFEHTGRSE
jgi:hypothetical protein